VRRIVYPNEAQLVERAWAVLEGDARLAEQIRLGGG
jgi:hypothetical protein